MSADCRPNIGELKEVKVPDSPSKGEIDAALSAEGETRIENVKFIDRGYDHIEKVLSSLGADIKRRD